MQSLRVLTICSAGAILVSVVTETHAATATLTSADFDFGFTASAAASTSGNTWTTSSNTNSSSTQGSFTFTPAPQGSHQSNTGPKFDGSDPANRLLLTGGGTGVDRVGALSDPFNNQGGFLLSITGSYNGPAPIDAAVTPNYRLQIEITKVSIYAASNSGAGQTLRWDETTAGHGQFSSSISLVNTNNNATLLNDAASYTQLLWNPDDYDTALASLNDSFSRTFDFLPGTGNDGKIGDGIEVEGRVHLVYDVVPEPASLGVLALGAVGLLSRRRKI